jgi:hypothetical protein
MAGGEGQVDEGVGKATNGKEIRCRYRSSNTWCLVDCAITAEVITQVPISFSSSAAGLSSAQVDAVRAAVSRARPKMCLMRTPESSRRGVPARVLVQDSDHDTLDQSGDACRQLVGEDEADEPEVVGLKNKGDF